MRVLDRPVPFSRIFLDLENPRHVAFNTEDEAIEYLCKEEYVLELAKDIAAIGLNPLERVALLAIPGQPDAYLMAEGNRRLCALKLLADPDRAPSTFRKNFVRLADGLTFPQELEAVLFESPEEVRPWLERLHNGANEGRGRRSWNSDQSQRYSGSSKNKIAQAFLDYAQNNGLLSQDERRRKLTTVQRFLSVEGFREFLGLDTSDLHRIGRTRPAEEFRRLSGIFIRDLVDGAKVNSRMNKSEIISYARSLSATPNISTARVESEPLVGAPETGATEAAAPKSTPPPRPEKIRRLQHSNEIKTLLDKLGNFKLQSLYYSICNIDLEHHTPLVSVGVWSFFETLTASAGRKNDVSFPSFFSKERLKEYGLTSNSTITAALHAITRISEYGNVNKHNAVAATFNPKQLDNDLKVLNKVVEKCIEAAISTNR